MTRWLVIAGLVLGLGAAANVGTAAASMASRRRWPVSS